MMESKHNYGVDMLKLLAMFMVVVGHILGGGVLQAVPEGSVSYHVAWLMECGIFCAVNVFAMTTGYLMYGRQFKLSRTLGLWVQVFFYSLVGCAVVSVLSPGTVGIKQWLRALLPVSLKSWWYVSAFFALSLLAPFLNKMVNALTKRQMAALVVVILLLAAASLLVNAFAMDRGYSVIWLMFLYVIGAAIRKYDHELICKKRWCLAAYGLAVVLAWLSREVMKFVTQTVFGQAQRVDMFLNYLSPLVVVMAVSLLLLFRCVKFPAFVNKIVSAIAPLSFAVYLIHMHPSVWPTFFEYAFGFLAEGSTLFMVLSVLGFGLLIFAVCILADWLRVQLFRLLGINRLVKKIGETADKWLNIYIYIYEKPAHTRNGMAANANTFPNQCAVSYIGAFAYRAVAGYGDTGPQVGEITNTNIMGDLTAKVDIGTLANFVVSSQDNPLFFHMLTA